MSTLVVVLMAIVACQWACSEYRKRLKMESLLSSRQKVIEDMAKAREEYCESMRSLNDTLATRDQEIERLQKLDLELAERLNFINATLQKREAELTNMRESMRNDRIRSDAKIEGLEKQLRHEQAAAASLRHRLAEAEKSIAGQRRENQSAIHHHAEAARQRDQIAVELAAAKTLLAGVKIGVGELLIVQPDGECTEDAVQALRQWLGQMDGKVVVVSHVNAWRATPIPKPLDVTKPIKAMFSTDAGKEMERVVDEIAAQGSLRVHTEKPSVPDHLLPADVRQLCGMPETIHVTDRQWKDLLEGKTPMPGRAVVTDVSKSTDQIRDCSKTRSHQWNG